MSRRRYTIGLVVPELSHSGGVQSVASFLKDVILESSEYTIKVISLSASSTDSVSALVKNPLTLLRGPQISVRTWSALSVTHVGAWLGELEFMRYQSRDALAESIKECDLIQVVCGGPAWANAVIGLGKPVSLQCATRTIIERRRRDSKVRRPLDLWRKWMTRITDYYDNRALRKVDAIQVENPWMLEYAQKVNRGRGVDIQYATPGVDETVFFPLVPRKSHSTPYILCTARFDDPRKNIELLLEAYALLPMDVRSNTTLKLAGLSSPPPSFWARAIELGLDNSIDYVKNPDKKHLIRLYQNASVFALPSDEEGLGIVLLEAMSCGIPVVSTMSGGPDGIITHGVDGFLTPLNDAQSMSLYLHALLQDSELNIKMGAAARGKILRDYSKPVTQLKFLAVWRRLLTEP